MIQYKIGTSAKTNIKEAVLEATKGLVKPKLILFFAPVEHFEDYTKQIKEAFSESVTMGTTTFAALCKDGAYKETLMVVGIEDGIECYGGVLEDADQYPIKYVRRIEEAMQQLKGYENTICFEFSSALISSEEFILSTLNSVVMDKKIPVVGGSAGDRGKAIQTMVSFDGQVYDKACVFVFIRNLGGKIHLYQENIYKATGHHFTATKVDVKKRIVYEYDHKPAAEVVAKALGTTINQLPYYLDSYPVGRIIGEDMYITANQAITAEKGIAYHARVYKNAHMVQLEPDNYREVIAQTCQRIKEEVPEPSFAIVIHCLARSILFEGDHYLNDFAIEMGQTLGKYVGFGGYGEQLRQQHFNQTMVVIVFE